MSPPRPASVKDILARKDVPAVAVDDKGAVTFINGAFEKEFGWSRADLQGQPLVNIIPPAMREAHRIGFSRFIATGSASLLGRSLRLPVLCKDGRERQAEHYIMAEGEGGSWRLAALISP